MESLKEPSWKTAGYKPDLPVVIEPEETQQKAFDHSDNVEKLAVALVKAQAEMKPAVKNAMNPFYKSRYVTLDAMWDSIRDPLTKNGLSVIQIPTAEGLTTILMHESGQWISGRLPYNAKDVSPQGIGSAITYARRYALGAIVGQATDEDDDGNLSMNRGNKATSTSKFRKSPPVESPPASATSKDTTHEKDAHTPAIDDKTHQKRLKAIGNLENKADAHMFGRAIENWKDQGKLTDDEYQDLKQAWSERMELFTE